MRKGAVMVKEIERNDLDRIFPVFLDEMGMKSHASYLLRHDFDYQLTPTDMMRLLDNYGVNCFAGDWSQINYEDSPYPVLLIPEGKEAYLFRRVGDEYYRKNVGEDWEVVSLRSIRSDLENAHAVQVNALPTEDTPQDWFDAYLQRFAPTKWVLVALSLMAAFLGLATPLFAMVVYDRVIGGNAVNILPSLYLGAFMALVFIVSLQMSRSRILHQIGYTITRDIEDSIYRKLLNMPLTILSRVNLSSHLTRLRGPEQFREFLSGPLGNGVVDTGFSVVALIAIAVLGGWLVLVPLISLCVYYGLAKLLKSRVIAAQTDAGIGARKFQNKQIDLIRNGVELRLSGDMRPWAQQYARTCRNAAKGALKSNINASLMSAMGHALGMLTALATLAGGITLIFANLMTPGGLIASMMLVWRITSPAQLAFVSGGRLHLLSQTKGQINRFMTTKSESHRGQKLEILDSDVAPTLDLDRVSLRFSAEMEPALMAVSTNIKPGEFVVVTGPVGAGKTSILRVLMGMYPAQSGYAMINRKNVSQYDPDELQTWIGYVAERPELIEGNLWKNITCQDTLSDLEKQEIMKDPIVTEKLAHFDFDETLHPAKVSIVESKYISMLRAFIKYPKLYLLDEPFLDFDPEMKQLILKRLMLQKGIATIVIATHDPELMKIADKVVVMEKGSIIYDGPMPEQSKLN